MQWLINKDPIRLALVAMMWNLIVGFILAILQALVNIDSATSVAGIIALYIVGAGYAQKYGVVMEKETRNKVSGIFSLIQYVMAFVAYYFIKIDVPMIAWLLIITAITAILYFISSWFLGFAGRIALKNKSKS